MQDAIQLEFDKIEGDVRVHCDNRNRFIVTADEKVTAFLELERRFPAEEIRWLRSSRSRSSRYRAHWGQPSDSIASIDLERHVVEERPAGGRF